MGVVDETLDLSLRLQGFLYVDVGVVVDTLANQLVRVNVGGVNSDVPNVGLSKPVIGDAVRLLRNAAGFVVVLGPSKPRPDYGTITATGATHATVLGPDGVTYGPMPFLMHYTPVVGHLVQLNWRTGGIIEGRMSALPDVAVPVVIPPPPTGPVNGTTSFTARDSGSYRFGSWWTNDVWYGTNNDGAWFYGTKIRDTLRGATARAGFKIYLPVKQASGAGSVTFRLHTSASRPAGTVTFGSSTSVAGADTTGWWPLPTSWAQALIDGTARGVGVDGAGLRVFTGTAGAPNTSGKLSLPYRR